MQRITSWLVSASIAIVAASLALGLFLLTSLSMNQSALVGIFFFLFLALAQLLSGRGNVGGGVAGRLEDIGESNAKLAREVSNLSLRLSDIEVSLAHRLDDSVEQRMDPVITAISEMRAQLDEAVDSLHRDAPVASPVAAHPDQGDTLGNGVAEEAVDATQRRIAPNETPSQDFVAELVGRGLSASQLAELLSMQRNGHDATAGDGPAQNGAAGSLAHHAAAEPAVPAAPLRSGPFADLDAETIAAMVREAVENNHIELFLQPIVGLPQRKVRYYEASPRLRTEDGELMAPEDYSFAVKDTAMLPAIDATLFVQCVQVTRRLQSRNREIGIFIDLAAETLTDERFSNQFIEFAEHNQAVSSAIIFELAQSAYDDFGPLEFTSLDQLAEHGFRFSLDHVARLDFDPAKLATNRIKFVKVRADVLLDEQGGLARDIHPADLSDLLGRHGIDLISDGISRESEVVDLIDYDLRLGQGDLFSPARPVRSDLLSERPQFPFERLAKAAAPKTAPAEPDPVNAPPAR